MPVSPMIQELCPSTAVKTNNKKENQPNKKRNPGPAGDGERFGTVTAQVQDLPGIPCVPKPGMWSSLTPIFI